MEEKFEWEVDVEGTADMVWPPVKKRGEEIVDDERLIPKAH
jgi:hypothetical protein